VTDRLRDLFDELVAAEPPLRTTPGDAAAAGRRLRRRDRTLWTAVGTALAVTTLVVVPRTWSPGPSDSDTAAASPSTGPSPAGTALVLTTYHACPAPPALLPQTDGSVLPDPDRAVAAVLAAARRIAPGMTFINRLATRLDQTPKWEGTPVLALIFDVGDDDGFGAVNLQVRPEVGATPAIRARSLNVSECVDVIRHDFPDGSVAIHYAYGPPAAEASVTHVWYYGVGGTTMNIGMFPQPWASSDDLTTPPPLPARGRMPLTISQVMEVADVVAHAR
jgi:hypothetical protein